LYEEEDQGFHFKKLVDAFDKQKKEYKNYLFEYTTDQEINEFKYGRQIKAKIYNDIENRFKVDNPIIQNFSVLDIVSLKENLSKENMKIYGNSDIQACAKHYNYFLTSHEEHKEDDETLDLNLTMSEWKTFKTDMVTNHLGATVALLTERVKNAQIYACLPKLYSFMSVIPFTSVECERTFSAMNLIMTPLRNCLLTDTLDDLLLISVHGPEDISEFDPKPAIKLWQSSADRRFI